MKKFTDMKINPICSQRGFTLIELMIVVSIITILVTPLIYLEICYSERFYSNIYRQDMTEAGNRSLEWIAKDLRSATDILKHWQNESLSSDRLILKSSDNCVIIYAFNKEQRVLSRASHCSTASESSPTIMQLALYIDKFEIAPVDPDADIVHIHLELSREVLHFREKITINSVAARRIR